MEETLKNISTCYSILFSVFLSVLLYLSLKKCFLKEGQSRGKLFFRTLLTNPIPVYYILVFSTAVMAGVVIMFFKVVKGEDPNMIVALSEDKPIIYLPSILLSTILFVFMMILFARSIGKKMKVPNLSLVTYVYLIFSVVFILSEGGTFKETDGSLVFFYSVGIAKTTVLFIATLLIYLLVIRALSELTDRKREINWKLFVISPSVFIPVYTVVDYVSYMYGGEKVYIASQFFSTVILFLFIWAFYIIIKNINATNEAIDARETIKTLSVEVMEALAHTIDAKDKYTNGHSIRVAKYSRMIAEKMGLDAGTCENIYYMGLLHDIGKIGVSNEIINKPSRLTEAEYDIIKTHPGIGYNILFEIKSNPALAIGAHWHHERYDGKGYPDGIAGEDIPLEARIIAVADSYDAMTSNRSYRNYLPQEKVREEIEKNIGTQFDPEAAKCMLAIMEEDREYRLHE